MFRSYFRDGMVYIVGVDVCIEGVVCREGVVCAFGVMLMCFYFCCMFWCRSDEYVGTRLDHCFHQ